LAFDLGNDVAELVDVRLERREQARDRRPSSISLAALDVGEGSGVGACSRGYVLLSHVRAPTDQAKRFAKDAAVSPISRAEASFSGFGHRRLVDYDNFS
jgi:hypothetical protein